MALIRLGRTGVGFLILAFLRASGPAADAREALAELESKSDLIRVRLVKHVPAVVLEGTDLEFQKQPAPLISQRVGGKVRISRDRVGDRSVWILNQDSVIRMIAGPALFVSGKDLRLNGEPVPERLVVTPSDPTPSVGAPAPASLATNLNVLAAVQIEEYVRGVLPAEMSLRWPVEALKAQAVAIRTYATYKQQHRGPGSSYDVESSYLDQVFRTHRTSVLRPSKSLRRAIEETSGQILVTARDQVGAAYFHADCGGKIESPAVIWNEGAVSKKAAPDSTAAAKIVYDQGCALNPRSRWNLSVSRSEILRRLKVVGHWESMVITKTSPGGHVLEVRLRVTGAPPRLVSGEALRAALGYSRLRSTQFVMTDAPNANTVKFNGRGFGHGVGLCQHGARYWALLGWTYEKILAHYYPYLHLKGSPPARAFAQSEDGDGDVFDPSHRKL